MSLEQGKLGYRPDLENVGYLEYAGEESQIVMRAYRDKFPTFNPVGMPTDVMSILNQGNQGSCQGHALAMIFAICYYLATGRKEAFSRACGYYIAQAYDGIRSDDGSTLSGGQKVATQHGMCLEKDWPYPQSYDPRKPTGITFPFKMKVTKPMRTVAEVEEWIEAGLPIQIGVAWDDFANKEIVTSFTPGSRSGGHSTTFWRKRENGNVHNINSWGRDWSGDGVHEWTMDAIRQALSHRWTVFIGYAPDDMEYPVPDPIG